MRRPIVPEIYVDISDVIDEKEKLLGCHVSQKEWLDATQGFDSYVKAMREAAQAVGRLSGSFHFAEGWRRHSHVGFSRQDGNPIARRPWQRLPHVRGRALKGRPCRAARGAAYYAFSPVIAIPWTKYFDRKM